MPLVTEFEPDVPLTASTMSLVAESEHAGPVLVSTKTGFPSSTIILDCAQSLIQVLPISLEPTYPHIVTRNNQLVS